MKNLSNTAATPGKIFLLIAAAVMFSLFTLLPVSTQAQSLFPGAGGSTASDTSSDAAAEGDQTPLATLLEVLALAP